jgi:chemotaxis protein MotB
VIQETTPEVKDPSEQKSRDAANGTASEAAAQAMRDAMAKREEAAFASAAESIRQALQDMPELAELSKNIIVDQTPEGLRIQLVDQEGRSLFSQGSPNPNERAKVLLRALSKIINTLPNRISISGHTAVSMSGSTVDSDWGLSSARADASRRVLQSAGVEQDRIYQVSGKANSEPLYIDDPTLPGNRRIAIVLLREAPVLPPDNGL